MKKARMTGVEMLTIKQRASKGTSLFFYYIINNEMKLISPAINDIFNSEYLHVPF